MPNLTTVTLTSGAPTAGTGTVSTLDNLIGTAGTGSAQVLTVQGNASGTAVPVSGTVTANAGTNLNTSALALETGGNLASASSALGATSDAAVTAGATGSISAKLRSISRDIIANIVLAAGSNSIGTVVLGAGSAIAGLFKVSDGTNTAAVKAASTAAVASDPALVVALSPNNIDVGSGTGGSHTIRTIVDSSQLAALSTTAQTRSTGFQLIDQPTDGTLVTKGLSNKVFSVAFTTLTRPANTTAYSAADSISNSATAGSVTALSATLSDTNNDPIFLTDILIASTDTGLAGKRVRAYLFNSDPTASSGVGAGDNSAYSQKQAGYVASFSGVLETGFSDGTVGRLVPTFNDGATSPTPNAPAGGFVCVPPTSGAKTLYIQYQAVDGFTPSASSTTIIGTARGWQARAN